MGLSYEDTPINPITQSSKPFPVQSSILNFLFQTFTMKDLLREVVERVRPRLHIFGHVHEGKLDRGSLIINFLLTGYGVLTNGETVFINASTCNKKYQPVNKPLVFTLKSK